MNLQNSTSEIYVPDGSPVDAAIARTTHMGIGAHQDDIEVMAYHGIVECFHQKGRAFMGVVVTDGGGSPRVGFYADYTDEQMRAIRRIEQKKAAFMGEYCAQALLDYPSSAVKDGSNADVIDDLEKIIDAARPEVIYTHNLADKHDTHVATVLRVIQAVRELPEDARPQHLYGCEVWRSLDWLNDDEKIILDTESHENLARALLEIYDSQVSGGKRYDLAVTGRRRANATLLASHDTDVSTAITFAMDLTPLMHNQTDPEEYVAGFIRRFAKEAAGRIGRLA